MKILIRHYCSNCGKRLGESAIATLDGNPKHGRMCLKCSDEVLKEDDPMGEAFTKFLESQGTGVVDVTPKKGKK